MDNEQSAEEVLNTLERLLPGLVSDTKAAAQSDDAKLNMMAALQWATMTVMLSDLEGQIPEERLTQAYERFHAALNEVDDSLNRADDARPTDTAAPETLWTEDELKLFQTPNR